MRNLAKLLLARGIAVSGSDLKDSKGLARAAGAGRRRRGRARSGARRRPDPDAVVVSSAIGERNVELVEARASWHPGVGARPGARRADGRARASIAVAGTHGKTTTTSMVAVVLERAGLDPSFLVGGDLNESGSGARSGAGDLFVFEADESDGSFLLAPHRIGIVTNVDVDHVDFYPGGRDEIEAAFAEFMTRCERVVACGDDAGVRAASSLARHARSSRTGPDPANDWTLAIDAVGPGGARGAVTGPDGDRDAAGPPGGRRAQPVERRRRRGDRRARSGVAPSVAAEALAGFAGVRRRFELRGSARGADFYDDYGHVPVELAVTLGVARRTGPRAADGGVPAPSVLAHAGALARAGREPDRGRRGRGDRRLRGRPDPDPRRDRQARRRRRSPRPRRRRASCTCRTARTSCASSATRSARATWSSRWAAATCGCWATRRSSGSGRRRERHARPRRGHPAGRGRRPRPDRVPARPAHVVPARRSRGALPGAGVGRGSGGRRRGDRRDRRPVRGDREGLEHPGLRRGVPGAGAAARPRLPVGGARRRPADGGRRDPAPRARRRRAPSRAARAGVRRRDPRDARRGGADERGRARRRDGRRARADRDVPAARGAGRDRRRPRTPASRYRRSALAEDAVVTGARRPPATRATPSGSAHGWTRRASGAAGPSRSPSRTAGASSPTRRATTRPA